MRIVNVLKQNDRNGGRARRAWLSQTGLSQTGPKPGMIGLAALLVASALPAPAVAQTSATAVPQGSPIPRILPPTPPSVSARHA